MSDRRFVFFVVFVSTILTFLLIHVSTIFYLRGKIDNPKWLKGVKEEIRDREVTIHIEHLEEEYVDGFNDALDCLLRKNLVKSNKTWGEMCNECREMHEIKQGINK